LRHGSVRARCYEHVPPLAHATRHAVPTLNASEFDSNRRRGSFSHLSRPITVRPSIFHSDHCKLFRRPSAVFDKHHICANDRLLAGKRQGAHPWAARTSVYGAFLTDKGPLPPLGHQNKAGRGFPGSAPPAMAVASVIDPGGCCRWKDRFSVFCTLS